MPSQAQVLGSNDVLFFLFFNQSLLTFVTKMITSQAFFLRIVVTAFRRWIMLVKSDKTAFVLVLRSSEKLSFTPLKGAIEKQRRFHCDFLLCPLQSGVCMSDSASY